MMTHIIKIHQGAVIVNSMSGQQYPPLKTEWLRRGFVDPNSGCMCFFLHNVVCYLMEAEDYTIISEL